MTITKRVTEIQNESEEITFDSTKIKIKKKIKNIINDCANKLEKTR